MLYHVTLRRNVSNILKEGLQPRVGVLSRDLGEKIPRVYLFEEVSAIEDALMNWFVEALFDMFPDEPLSVLEVNATVEEIGGEREAFEVHTEHGIPSKLIREMSADELGFDLS